MAEETILFTGGTGFVGFRTLLEALGHGYSVRAAVRSQSKIEQLKNATSLQPHLSNLTFIIVSDIMSSDAFHEATRGVDAIVHMASPVPKGNQDFDEEDILQPAIKATTSILQAALRQRSVRRVVITSSSFAARGSNASTEVYTADNIVPVPQGPFGHSSEAYAASKVAALAATRNFIAEHKPHFTVINILPSFVIGKNELATTPDEVANGSNSLALSPLLGVKYPTPMPAMICHVDDVARVHIAALDPKLQGNHNLGVNYRSESGTEWDKGITIARKHFAEAIEQGIFPLGGSVRSVPDRFDATATEQRLGMKFKNQEEMLISIASWYLKIHAS